MSVASQLAALQPIGRNGRTGGYERLAWSAVDLELRTWFFAQAAALGLDTEVDRNGNLWAWWHGHLPGTAVVIGSHLDSVPSGGAYDGPLGVISAFEAVRTLQEQGYTPERPVAIVSFSDEEGGRFGVACSGSRLMVGVLAPERAAGLKDRDGTTMAEAMQAAGHDVNYLGFDAARIARIGEFIELHIEQGHLPSCGIVPHAHAAHADGGQSSAAPAGLAAAGVAVGMAEQIWPHGRWRADLIGTPNHAGTTPMHLRNDPMLTLAGLITEVRAAAEELGALATIGKIQVQPGAVNAIAASVSAWIDARAGDEAQVRAVIARAAERAGTPLIEESWTPATLFDTATTEAVAAAVAPMIGQGLPLLPSGAGHDAGVLAEAGIRTAMLLVRNPTGVSHAPDEYAEASDAEIGVAALAAAVRARTSKEAA